MTHPLQMKLVDDAIELSKIFWFHHDGERVSSRAVTVRTERKIDRERCGYTNNSIKQHTLYRCTYAIHRNMHPILSSASSSTDLSLEYAVTCGAAQ